MEILDDFSQEAFSQSNYSPKIAEDTHAFIQPTCDIWNIVSDYPYIYFILCQVEVWIALLSM